MFKALGYFLLVASVCGVQFDITNRDGGEIWIGIQGNSNKPTLENGGFKLGSGQTRSVHAPDNWAGRFWSRQWCNSGNGQCLVGNCNGVECQGRGGNPPVTLVEITLRGSGNQDFYDISLVDGFSTFATIRPINGQGHCKAIECKSRINNICPNELKFHTPRGVLGCMSSCLKHTNNDQFCCRNQYGTRETCNIDHWPNPNSARFFKQHCPDAYSYAYDDPSSIFTCRADKYEITFGG
ncbi:uncharacterized protein LOC109607484 isoform X1 [Aethina tumida]|uniref:uncharacterized protein LOC109607484 isoform X1 n=1 Tax=Aethina tumida TaxID=116153 RepID=UPI002147D432|nr:uncharacterized protein LOC109607484 isoform X1 [Aethina tumida]